MILLKEREPYQRRESLYLKVPLQGKPTREYC